MHARICKRCFSVLLVSLCYSSDDNDDDYDDYDDADGQTMPFVLYAWANFYFFVFTMTLLSSTYQYCVACNENQ